VQFFSELKRRNVLRMAVLYVVASWLVMQVAEVIIGLANLPEWLGPAILAVLAIGFPIALIFSWFYELTPEGLALDKDVETDESITRVSGRRVDFIIIAMLCSALLLFAYDKWWPDGPMEQSIAVLAFENRSGDPEQEYFSDGISEDILTLLARIEPLKVIARTSSFSFKGKDVDIATIAAQLKVRHVLEGSVRRAGDRLRVTAQLIDATDSTQVWSQTYDRDLGDIFAVQDEIAAAITDALEVQLALVDGAPMLPHVIKAANVEAYDAYLKGRALFRSRGADNIEAAVGEFERALRLDADFAPAHAQLAIASSFLGRNTDPEAAKLIASHLDRAAALAPDLADVYVGRGIVAEASGEFESAVDNYRKALARNPSYGDAMNWLYIDLKILGRYEEADAAIEASHAADPLDRVIRSNYAEWLFEKGRINEAREIVNQMLADDARWGHWTHANLAIFYEGKLAEGLSSALQVPHHWWASRILSWVGEYDEARRISPGDSQWVDADMGDWDSAVRDVQDQLRETPDDLNALTFAGSVLVQAGNLEDALPLLERALDMSPEGRPIATDLGLRATIWLAEARRHSGDESGAQIVTRIARHDVAAQRASGRDYTELWLVEAMLAAFDNDTDRVIASLRRAIKLGLREKNFKFSESSFVRFRDDPQFVALRGELESLIAKEREQVLQLICFSNPAPQEWQPLPETCEGVTRH
jgi:TolB-like protein